jgi:hypothetical protein
MNRKITALAVCTGVLIAATAVYAQAPTALEQAELAGLSPEMRTQVQSRAVGDNSVTEVLQVMLLNNTSKPNIRRAKSSRWIGQGVWRSVEQSGGGLATVQFDPATLQIKS